MPITTEIVWYRTAEKLPKVRLGSGIRTLVCLLRDGEQSVEIALFHSNLDLWLDDDLQPLDVYAWADMPKAIKKTP